MCFYKLQEHNEDYKWKIAQKKMLIVIYMVIKYVNSKPCVSLSETFRDT